MLVNTAQMSFKLEQVKDPNFVAKGFKFLPLNSCMCPVHFILTGAEHMCIRKLDISPVHFISDLRNPENTCVPCHTENEAAETIFSNGVLSLCAVTELLKKSQA